jgi:hypothetical protein
MRATISNLFPPTGNTTLSKHGAAISPIIAALRFACGLRHCTGPSLKKAVHIQGNSGVRLELEIPYIYHRSQGLGWQIEYKIIGCTLNTTAAQLRLFY